MLALFFGVFFHVSDTCINLTPWTWENLIWGDSLGTRGGETLEKIEQKRKCFQENTLPHIFSSINILYNFWLFFLLWNGNFMIIFLLVCPTRLQNSWLSNYRVFLSQCMENGFVQKLPIPWKTFRSSWWHLSKWNPFVLVCQGYGLISSLYGSFPKSRSVWI